MNPAKSLHTSAHHVRFVPAVDKDDGSFRADGLGKKRTGKWATDGSHVDAAELYKEVLALPSTAHQATADNDTRKRTATHSAEPPSTQRTIKSVTRLHNDVEAVPYDARLARRKEMALLRAAQDGNIDELEQLLKESVVNVDARDDFGWTPLMCAAAAGKVQSVFVLMSYGADINAQDKQQKTAKALAQRQGHTAVVGLMNEWSVAHSAKGKRRKPTPEATDSEIKSSGFRTTANIEDSQHCDMCGIDVLSSDIDTHVHGIMHMFNEQRTPYHITNSNLLGGKGYQIMRKSGWDDGQGLGVDQSGIKNPVKTVLKRDRFGVGVKNEATVARVTHFPSFDKAAVADKRVKEVKLALTKRDIERQIQRDRRKERNLRNYLNSY